jgi:hypothetical protein
MTQGFEASAKASTTLDERFGKPSEFTPPDDGAIPPARIEAFLAVREATGPARAAIAGIFGRFPTREEAEALDKKPFTEKLVTGFGIARTGMGLPTAIADFFQIRDEALVAQEMGMGEYSYIYTLAYHSWLGHDPADAPLREHPEGSAPVPAGVQWRIQTDLVAMLENQAASLPTDAPQAWRDRLAAEIAALKEDRSRVPWQGDVPETVAASLEPYRARLEASYTPATNLFELARNRKKGSFSYQSE